MSDVNHRLPCGAATTDAAHLSSGSMAWKKQAGQEVPAFMAPTIPLAVPGSGGHGRQYAESATPVRHE